MNEYRFIKKLFSEKVPRLFESDAQIISINGQNWGITCDTFSLEEDLFTSDDPYRLGCNLAAATLSDLTATGCEASFFMHSITLAKHTDEQWTIDLVKGITDTLDQASCLLIGGDMGQAEQFSYTGIALGRQVIPISRIFPAQNQSLYITGVPGGANKAILENAPTPLFKLHPLRQDMLACIDTSGGFMDALWQLHTLNPGFRINVTNIPVADMNLLFGGAGEYELLFTSDKPIGDCLLIGDIKHGQQGLFLNGVPIVQPPPDPRSFGSLDDYIKAVFHMTHELF